MDCKDNGEGQVSLGLHWSGEAGRRVAHAHACPSALPPHRDALAGACPREVEAEMAPRGRASGRRAEVGVRAEVAGWSRGLGGDRDRR